MVRVPASWAGRMAGLAGSGQSGRIAARRIPVTDVSRYVIPVTVDLGNDGVAPQITFPGFLLQTQAAVTSPGATVNVLFTQVPAGTYLVQWTVTLAGTVSASDVNNFALYANGSFVTSSVNPGAVGSYPQTPQLVTLNGGPGDLKVLTNGAGTVGSQYSATFPQNLGIPGTATALVGPQGLGQSWALDQCYLSTSVGQLDPAQCQVFAGPLPLPQMAVTGSLRGGSSQFGLGGLGIADGWFIYAVWSAGTPGAQCYLRVTGTKTVLSAG